jgi:hypothetical protein
MNSTRKKKKLFRRKLTVATIKPRTRGRPAYVGPGEHASAGGDGQKKKNGPHTLILFLRTCYGNKLRCSPPPQNNGGFLGPKILKPKKAKSPTTNSVKQSNKYPLNTLVASVCPENA